jgi:hypothetical protein
MRSTRTTGTLAAGKEMQDVATLVVREVTVGARRAMSSRITSSASVGRPSNLGYYRVLFRV